MAEFLIKEVYPHPGFHFDEVPPYNFANRYENKILKLEPGAQVILKRATFGELEGMITGRWLIGQHDGGMFNDKSFDGNRIEGESTTTRTAKWLDIYDRDELQPLINNARRVDVTPTATATDLSKLIKDARRSEPPESHKKLFMGASRAVDAIIDYYLASEKVSEGFIRPDEILRQMVAELDTEADPRPWQRMYKMILAGEKRIENCLELWFISRAFKVTGMADAEASLWIKSAMKYMLHQQVEYWRLVDQIDREKPFMDLHPRYADHVPRLVTLQTDSPIAFAASRNPDVRAAITLIQNSRGNVAILSDHRQVTREEMMSVAALIRLEQTPIDCRGGINWDAYIQPGTVRYAPNIYVKKEGSGILNGSESHEAVPIGVTLERLKQLINLGRFPHYARCMFERATGKSTAPLPNLPKPIDRKPVEPSLSVDDDDGLIESGMANLSWQERKEMMRGVQALFVKN